MNMSIYLSTALWLISLKNGGFMNSDFIEALKSKDLAKIRKISKSDLHNHAPRGGNKRYIEEWKGIKIPDAPIFKNLNEMNDWNLKNIKPFIKGVKGYEKRIEAAFVQANMDGVRLLNMSFNIDEVSEYANSVENMINSLKKIHLKFAPNIIFIPEIALGSYMDTDEVNEKLNEFLHYDYFKSIDIYGDENNLFKFKKVFKKAKNNGLILKAHVGEFGCAELVQRVVEELELNQVQHGISAANSKSVMKWLANNKIQLNICPTSNIYLSRVENYSKHPIRKLYDNGVKVTVNTDDMIIFDKSVSEEFLNLYNAGVFNCEELDEIRENGLKLLHNV